MAELTMTDEEKKTPFGKWDDASLGRLVKANMLTIADGDLAAHTMMQSAALMLVSLADQVRSDHSTVNLRSVTVRGSKFGDWDIEVRRVDADGVKGNDNAKV